MKTLALFVLFCLALLAKAQNNVRHPIPGDLGICFNKVDFSDPAALPLNFLPLTPKSYPINNFSFQYLKDSNAVSVVTQSDIEVKYDIKKLVEDLGGLPSHPNSDPNHPFWGELEEVIDFQLIRRKNPKLPISTLLDSPPELWGSLNIDEGAEAVHDEYPGHWQSMLIESFTCSGFKVDPDIIPARSRREFLRGIVMLADLNTWAISVVGPNSFAVKWYAGRVRPEEVVFKISTGQLNSTHGVPKRIIRKVKKMKLKSPSDFTAYPEGCPTHPSWPAMHSAASSSSLWLSVVLDLTPEQFVQAKRVDHAVAMARTIAGVHYRSDNIFGLNLGQKVISDLLPDYLAERYGSNKDAVRAKIDRLRWTWPTSLS